VQEKKRKEKKTSKTLFSFDALMGLGMELELYNRKGKNSRYNLLLENLSI